MRRTCSPADHREIRRDFKPRVRVAQLDAICLTKDRDALPAFYDFPAEHWKHSRSTNPIESTFATVRHRTKADHGCEVRRRNRGRRPIGCASTQSRLIPHAVQNSAIALALALEVTLPTAKAETIGSRKASDHEYWSWREIDGRRCRYRGHRRISKKFLSWGQ